MIFLDLSISGNGFRPFDFPSESQLRTVLSRTNPFILYPMMLKLQLVHRQTNKPIFIKLQQKII